MAARRLWRPTVATSTTPCVGLYFIVRDYDLTSTTPFQPGATKNFAQVLFSGTSSVIAKSANAGLIRAAFLVPNYHDEGDAHTTP